jgi:GNAT superfamily N-acetyltransferase
VWDLHVDEALRRRGIGTWLVGHAADWLRFARVERLVDYAVVGEGDAHLAFLGALGWRELTRTRRGWERRQERRLCAARAATRTGSYTPEKGGA